MSVPRAARPGVLSPTPAIDGIALPPGHLVTADASVAGSAALAGPIAWVSDDVVAEDARRRLLSRGASGRGASTLWQAVRAAFPRTGLWPVLATWLGDTPMRPWDDGEFDPLSVEVVDRLDAEVELRDAWQDCLPLDDDADDESGLEDLGPFGRQFPGLVAAPPPGTPVGDLVFEYEPCRLLLVPCTRPADAPALLGWLGATNLTTAARISAVLRSWEDRFGAELAGLGFDTLSLLVARPAGSVPEAQRVAAEHVAFCPDSLWQGAGSIEAMAADLVGQQWWSFWWD